MLGAEASWSQGREVLRIVRGTEAGSRCRWYEGLARCRKQTDRRKSCSDGGCRAHVGRQASRLLAAGGSSPSGRTGVVVRRLESAAARHAKHRRWVKLWRSRAGPADADGGLALASGAEAGGTGGAHRRLSNVGMRPMVTRKYYWGV